MVVTRQCPTHPAKLVVFEGIDGSGKTTLSNRVAERLRDDGLHVTHVREGGRLASDTAESIRQFTRDQRQLALEPFAELLLYLARESQQLEECVRPALARADVVIADRFFHTAFVLACAGRGLPAERVAPLVVAASQGLAPRLTILVDVDPHVARARRRADKIARPSERTSSRKGLSGAGLMQRLRAGYLERARAEPDAWLVVDNSAADFDALVDELAAVIRALDGAGPPSERVHAPARPARTPRDAGEAREAFLAWIDERATPEPEVAAYMLHGLAGEGFDERRTRLAARAPAIVASGLRALDDPTSWRLRERLAEVAPDEVARSLADLPASSDAAWALREQLAERAPAGVAGSLDHLADPRAWSLRQRLWSRAAAAVLTSLAGDDSPAAWILRDAWLDDAGGEAALADAGRARVLSTSLRGLAGPRAWQLRQACRAACPVGALLSLEGVVDARSWRWREEHLARAPRPVLRTIALVDDPRAWLLRTAALPYGKEALDSIVGLDQEAAWALRHEAADRWPSTVVKSLGELGLGARGLDLVARQLGRYPHDISLLKHAAALARPYEARQAVAG